MLALLFVYLSALATALPQSISSGPRVQFELQKDKIETGGQFECFGINAISDNHIVSILEISSNSTIDFYTGNTCDKDTLIYNGTQSTVGTVQDQVYHSDVLSIRIKSLY